MSKFRRATPLVALAFALAVPASTFAVTGSATVDESLTVIQAAAITVTGLPTTVNLGAALAGNTTSPVTVGTAVITPLGGVSTFSVTLSQSALTGPGSIPASASQWAIDTGSGYGGFAVYPLSGPILDQSIGTSVGLKTQWAIPAGTPAGAYTGTLTVTATGS